MSNLVTAERLLADLVGYPTVSSDSNLDLIRYVEDYLSGLGARYSVLYDETGGKANIFATMGPEGDGGIVLSGHTDVVPVDGQDWSSDHEGIYCLCACDGRAFCGS